MRYYLGFLMFFVIISFSKETNIVKKSCNHSCGGNITISYPFGIGYGCYLSDWYEVVCRRSVHGHMAPFLRKADKEVVEILLPKPLEHWDEYYWDDASSGSLRIKTRIASAGCSGGDMKDDEKVLDLENSPFSIREDNYLMAFGCNTTAKVSKISSTYAGCSSTCRSSPEIPPPKYFGEEDVICSGLKCCKTSIPIEAHQKVGVKIESNGGNNTREGCSVAFLTDEYDKPSLWWNNTDAETIYARKYETVQLKWIFRYENNSSIESLGCDESPSKNCSCHVIVSDSTGSGVAKCACLKGYEGNPYVQNGCKDIDECQKGNNHGSGEPCPGRDQICKNLPGSYQCVPKKNYRFLIYIGVSVGLSVMMMGLGIWAYRYMKKYRKEMVRRNNFKRNGGLLMASREGHLQRTILFTAKQLERATDNFSVDRVLGQGGQGTVFKGMLPDGRIIAVKKSKVIDEVNLQEFINEVCILTQISHRHVVNVLGCCLETQVPVVVYEFFPNGNLFQLLHEEEEDDRLITWELRLRIALDTADALSFLHSAAASPIYHRDVKSSNILLDENYRAKVSDFGTSRLTRLDQTHLTTSVIGTMGYMDPEYFQSNHYTPKSDVYSFGVVLAELITGENPVSSQRFGEDRTLATYFIRAVKENRLFDIIDSRIRHDCNLGQVMLTAKLAKKCLKLTGTKRPTMKEICLQLETTSSSAHPDDGASTSKFRFP